MSILDAIKARIDKDGRFIATASKGSTHFHLDSPVPAEIEIHEDRTGELALSIDYGFEYQYWNLDKQDPQPEPAPQPKIPLCRAFNKPETRGALRSCTSAVETITGVWVCRKDIFHGVDSVGPDHCKHKEIRTLAP